MTNDVELENWRREWLTRSVPADADAAERLRRRVLRETSWLKLGLIVPILVTLGIGGWVILRLRTGQPLDVLLAVETWAFIVVVWAVSFWIARGTWRPFADTTAAFVDLSIRRCEANLRGATFGAWLYVFQLVFLVVAIGAASPVGIVGGLKSSVVIVLGWLGVPTVLAGLHWFRRRQRADLEHLRDLKRQLRID
jgi:hypothetical protein